MIWPFKSQPKEEPKLPKLSDINFSGWSYTPTKDITPHEVALLLPLFIYPLWRLDYQDWIDRHNLRRHFTKIEE